MIIIHVIISLATVFAATVGAISSNKFAKRAQQSLLFGLLVGYVLTFVSGGVLITMGSSIFYFCVSALLASTLCVFAIFKLYRQLGLRIEL